VGGPYSRSQCGGEEHRLSYPVSSTKMYNVRFEVLKAVLLVLSTFRRTYRLHQAETHRLPPASSGFLLGVFIHYEDRGKVLPKRRSLFELVGVRAWKRTMSFNLFITRLRCLCNE
jgi:hypothetical protein